MEHSLFEKLIKLSGEIQTQENLNEKTYLNSLKLLRNSLGKA